ncbi:hypothetical protein SI65_06474 [Aspergillus cristatus]|uniref:BZIP domain-containing protein n=1 Tax=Aspergillus cristatus TaxID=573508 RepID=A0A1E3BBB1_ASPCR|nr:hypothetical protein SI65_06474 [Aspergillus cristatus]
MTESNEGSGPGRELGDLGALGANSDYDRRREQVRRAQKKHREGKRNRCRMLEDELHSLYNAITMAHELRDLRFENKILRDIMSRHSIPVPPDIRQQAPSFAEVTFINNAGHHQLLQVKLPGDENGSYERRTQVPPTSQDIHVPSSPRAGPAKPSNEKRDETCFSKGVISQMGVDFVLSLERPCLFHTRAPGEQEPSGHAISMQGILLSGAPQNLRDHAVWEVPAQQLDKLFELSGCLGLDGYITPVQAWNRIISRFDKTQLFDGRLERLRSSMIPHIKCYGFGALIEEKIFEDLMENTVRDIGSK